MRSFVQGWLHRPLTLTQEEFDEAAHHFGLNRLAAPALRERVEASIAKAHTRVRAAWACCAVVGIAVIVLIVQVGSLIPRGK